MGNRAMEVGGGSNFAVFIHGQGAGRDFWYRVELEENTFIPKGKLAGRKIISPFATMPWKDNGFGGSWEVIGDYIYWIGGYYHIFTGEDAGFHMFRELLKHNINDSSSTVNWETVSTTMKIPRASPLFTAIGKKLYVLLGTEYRPPDEDEDLRLYPNAGWDRCGEVYDMEKGTWEYLDPEFDDFLDYETFHTALVMKGDDDDEPTDIAFFDMYHPLLVFNFGEGKLEAAPESCLDGWSIAPIGSQGCNAKGPLIRALNNFNRVFDNNTFYWFASDLRLYGYDNDLVSWLVSPSLEHKFHNLQYEPDYTTLVRLGSGKLLVIVDEPVDHGCFTMATLAVHREKDEQGGYFLSVSVNSLQTFCLDESPAAFQPLGAKAVKLKNTSMRGHELQVMDDVCPIRKTEKIDPRAKAFFILMCPVGGLGILLFKSRN